MHGAAYRVMHAWEGRSGAGFQRAYSGVNTRSAQISAARQRHQSVRLQITSDIARRIDERLADGEFARTGPVSCRSRAACALQVASGAAGHVVATRDAKGRTPVTLWTSCPEWVKTAG